MSPIFIDEKWKRSEVKHLLPKGASEWEGSKTGAQPSACEEQLALFRVFSYSILLQ